MSKKASMLPPLLVHVGLHKTGTTWLQKQVFSAKHGREIEYCGDTGLIYRQFITPRMAEFSAATARAAFAPLLAKAAADGRLAVISGENLAGRPFHAHHQQDVVARRLAETFPQARILLTIREQNAIIYSMYGQYLRFGYTSSLSAFLTEPPENAPYHPVMDRKFYDYSALLDTYERYFPAENILTLPFEQLTSEPDATLEQLSLHCGTQLSAVGKQQAQKVANPAWSDLAYETVRFLNRFNSQDSRWQRLGKGLNPNAIAHHVSRLTPARIRQAMRARRMEMIAAAIGDSYAASNLATSARIGIDLARYGYRQTPPPSADEASC